MNPTKKRLKPITGVRKVTVVEVLTGVDFWFGLAVGIALEETARAALRWRVGNEAEEDADNS